MLSFTSFPSFDELRQLQNYLVLSLQTGGPDPETDPIRCLGMLRVEGREIVNRSHTYLDPEAVPVGDTTPVLRPERLAASLAKLLPGSVLVVSDGDLAFLQALLASTEASGAVCCLDPAFLLGIVFPELEGSSTEEAAKALFLRVEEETPVLADCERKHRILQACLSTAEAREEDEPELKVEEESPEEEEEEAVEAPRRKPRPSSGGGRRRRRRPVPMTDEESVWLVACIAAFIAALLYIPSVTTALYLLAAVLFCPWRVLRKGLRPFGLEGWKLAVLGVALCAAAFLLRPAHVPKTRSSDTDRPPAFIILSWNEPGDYGTEATRSDGEDYIEFHIPTGVYRVLNNNTASAVVSVFNDGEDPATDKSSYSATIMTSKSREFTLDEEQYFTISQGSEDVIFQYLSEVPEEVIVEETDDPNVTKVEHVVKYVNGTEVRLRRNPSLSSFVMATFDTGQEVTVTGTSGDWTAVTVDNQKGYIYSSFLSDTNPLESGG